MTSPTVTRPPRRSKSTHLPGAPPPYRPKTSRIPAPDPVDRLADVTGVVFHHDGPFEATLAARQIPGRAPVDALKESNLQTLLATPAASLRDSLEYHVPLQGVAMYRPGTKGLGDYEEYGIMTREGGFGRWGGVEYRDEDLKGKGVWREEGKENVKLGRSNTTSKLDGLKRRWGSLRRKEKDMP